MLSNPTRNGKDFVGWKYNGGFIDKIDSSIINSGKDITLEAIWSNYTYSVLEDDTGDKYISITGWDNLSEDIVIPDKINVNDEDLPVKEIGDSAFNNNRQSKSVTIPDSVAKIGDYAFENCSKITTISISESSRLTTIGYAAFFNCASLSSIYIPSGVTKIRSKALEGCSSFTSIFISENVTTIEEYAFRGCASLTSIFIPNSVTTISSHAFQNCFDLTIYCEASSPLSGWSSSWNYSDRPVVWSCKGGGIYGDFRYTIYIDENSELYVELVDYFGTDSNVVIPEFIDAKDQRVPVKVINEVLFGSNESMISIFIPESVTTIESYAFSDCTELTAITFGENS